MNTPLNKSFLAGKRDEDTENKIIIETLLAENEPLTRRRISEITGLELPTLCRALFNLTNRSRVLTVAQIKPCSVTKRHVYHYYFNEHNGGLTHE